MNAKDAMKPFFRIVLAIAAVTCLHWPGTTFAQPYPAKPIRLILGLGGAADTLARLLGQRISESMGQPILVDAQPAATGSIAASAVARAAPDGYTLLLAASSAMVYRLVLSKNTPYDPVRDFTPIAKLCETVLVVAASNTSQIKSMKELLEQARQSPGKVFYGTGGVGTTSHLAAELLQTITGVKLAHIPYKDPGQVPLDLAAGRIPLGFGIFGTMYPFYGAGKLHIIAINNSERFPRVPDIPTISEEVSGYVPPPAAIGFYGPSGMPRAIVQRLHAEIVKATKMPEVRDRIDGLGFLVTLGTPEELGEEVKRDLKRAASLVKAAGIEPE